MLRRFMPLLFAFFGILARPLATSGHEPGAPLKAGIIGLDTSHAIAFTRLLNDPKARGDLAGVRVVAAYPGGSKDVAASRDRIAGFTRQMRDELHIEIVASIEDLLKKVDVVLLLSVDGRKHLEQVRPVFRARKPVFIDKPLGGSLAEVLEIFRLAEENHVPCFSSSSLRFSPGIMARRHDPKVGEVLGCDAYGPCSLEEHHPDLFWYGIHGVEALYTIMGPGCGSVVRVQTKDTELVSGTWQDGRIGTFRGLRRGKEDYGTLVFGTKGIVAGDASAGYEPLVAEICKFFKTGRAPVAAAETVEIYTFMEAADESKRRGGSPVSLADVLAKARDQAAHLKKEESR